MAEVVKVCGVLKSKIASVCGIQNIKRICNVDFLVVVFGTVMSFLVPDDMDMTEGHTIEGDTIISGDPDKWIATKSKDHADDKQLVSAVMKFLLTNPVELIVQAESTATVLKVTSAVVIAAGNLVITDQGRAQVSAVTDHGNNLYTLTLATALTAAPAKVYLDPLKDPATVRVGAGAEGEYLGPKKVLSLKKGVPGSNILPTMTGPSTNGCTITASAEAGWFAWKVGNKVYGNDMWVAHVTAGVVTTADLTFTFSSVKTASGLRFILGPFDGASSDYQCRTVEVFLDGVSYKTFNMGDLSTGPRSRDLLFGENKSFTVMKLRCSNSTSGKWIGSRDIEILGAGTSAPSTKKVLVVVGSESNKDKILKADGGHKTILVAGTEHEVESVGETVGAASDKSILPVMIGGTTDGVTMSAVNQSSNHLAYQCADGVSATYFAGTTSWADIMVTFQVVKKLTKIKLGMRSGGGGGNHVFLPRTIIIQGRMNPIDDFVDIKTITTPSWGEADYRTFELGEVSSYKEFKLRLFNPENSSSLVVERLELLTSSTLYETTINLKNELDSVPAAETEVAIPDCLLDVPCALTCAIVAGGIEISGEKIVFENNPALRSMAMAAKIPAGWKIKDLKIIPERMG